MSSLNIGRICYQIKLAYLNNMENQILNYMDDEGSKQKQTSNSSVDEGIIPQSVGVRCTIFHGIESDRRFLCNYLFHFLPIISFIIWAIFLLT